MDNGQVCHGQHENNWPAYVIAGFVVVVAVVWLGAMIWSLCW